MSLDRALELLDYVAQGYLIRTELADRAEEIVEMNIMINNGVLSGV